MEKAVKVINGGVKGCRFRGRAGGCFHQMNSTTGGAGGVSEDAANERREGDAK